MKRIVIVTVVLAIAGLTAEVSSNVLLGDIKVVKGKITEGATEGDAAISVVSPPSEGVVL